MENSETRNGIKNTYYPYIDQKIFFRDKSLKAVYALYMKRGHKAKKIIGTLEMAYDGYGFVITEQKGVGDIFVPAPAIGDALHKDRVEIIVKTGRTGKKEGVITGILERGLKQLVGRFEIRGKSSIVITEDFRVRRQVVIPKEKEGGARHNEMVAVKILTYPEGGRPLTGEVIKKLGFRGSDQTELNILISRHHLPERYPVNAVKEAGKEAQRFYESQDEDREDLTHLPFITIDGEDAKDFDDAVYAEKLNGDSYRVYVSIADVSYFVKTGSNIDHEAAKRATSVYLPGICIPMLPEELSTNICSLLPQEMRYSFTAEMDIDCNGITRKSRFYKSKIKSAYRMTYAEANEYLSNGKKITQQKEVLKSLDHLNEAAAFFRKHRSGRGSMDFDLPEPEIVLDLTGKPENVVKADRNIAHMLIEDLMIAANEAVAVYLSRSGYSCIYRVHDRPNSEKLMELRILLKYLGHNVKIGREPTPARLSKVVRVVKDRPEERLINMLLLRSMSQAEYSIKNIGHFGLASPCYCHFTSPIRRYPDLLVHRLLGDAIGFEKYRLAKSVNYLKEEAKHSSKMERKAMEAERESLSLYSAIFMRDKIGEIYDGLISHTAKKGVFVELIDYFVEGLIKPEDLHGDYFRFDQKRFAFIGRKTGKTIHIGDRIKVIVKDVSTQDRRVYFEPHE